MKRILKIFLIIFFTLPFGFAAGFWCAQFLAGLESENNYPWELHYQLNTPSITCEDLKAPMVGSHFWVQPALAGSGVRLITYNRKLNTVSVSLIGPEHKGAYDEWELLEPACQ